MFRVMDIIYVIFGGAIGSALRYLVGLLPFSEGGLAWPTLIVNLAGSLLLGYVVGRGQTDSPLSRPVMMFLGPGLCGGFTTYSAFAVETTTLLERHAPAMMFAYLALTTIGCMLMAFLGFSIARSAS